MGILVLLQNQRRKSDELWALQKSCSHFAVNLNIKYDEKEVLWSGVEDESEIFIHIGQRDILFLYK